MWYKNLGGTFVRFVTIHAVTDGRRRTDTYAIGKTACILQRGKKKQVAQLSQRNRAAAWVSFGWVVEDGVGQ